MYHPIRNEKIYMAVIRQVRSLIHDGSLAPGDRLPPERELASLFSVSRASVRQAISTLEAQGIVHIRHGDGTYILDETERVIESFSRFLVEEQITPQEILETRKIIECEAVRLCAERASPDQVRKIQTLLERKRLAENSGASLAEMNYQLHRAIAEGSRNRGLIKVTEVLLEMMRMNMWPALKSRSEQREHRIEEHLSQHERIVEAIGRHDGPAASQAMKIHLEAIDLEMDADLEAETVPERAAGAKRSH